MWGSLIQWVVPNEKWMPRFETSRRIRSKVWRDHQSTVWIDSRGPVCTGGCQVIGPRSEQSQLPRIYLRLRNATVHKQGRTRHAQHIGVRGRGDKSTWALIRAMTPASERCDRPSLCPRPVSGQMLQPLAASQNALAIDVCRLGLVQATISPRWLHRPLA